MEEEEGRKEKKKEGKRKRLGQLPPSLLVQSRERDWFILVRLISCDTTTTEYIIGRGLILEQMDRNIRVVVLINIKMMERDRFGSPRETRD